MFAQVPIIFNHLSNFCYCLRGRAYIDPKLCIEIQKYWWLLYKMVTLPLYMYILCLYIYVYLVCNTWNVSLNNKMGRGFFYRNHTLLIIIYFYHKNTEKLLYFGYMIANNWGVFLYISTILGLKIIVCNELFVPTT